ncbi:MAG: glycerophosphodiester phosphodiesterase family protein [Candidatus Chromulinivorax sp.]|nr:glycerophosphodiester phosphodiesterase family protein [Candidatus Chromulinivorax sp.]
MKLNRYVVSILLALSSMNYAMDIIGHRGACGYKPENTLSSFALAVEMGVDKIELDVYVCTTGELVVIHDDLVDRTTNGHGMVINMSFEELRNLIVEDVEQIPTLQEVIELVDRRVPINVELKGPNTAQPVAELLINYMENGWMPNDFVASSFQHDQVDLFQKLCPEIETGVLFESDDFSDYIAIALMHNAQSIGLSCDLVTENLLPVDLIDNAHDNGLKVLMYTVNDRELADQLEAMGVDGIFSNYPDKMK